MALVAPLPLTATARGAAPALELLGSQQLSDRMVDLTFRTAATVGDTHVRVLLPTGYASDPTRRYPVLYLLHGGADNYTAWARPGGGDTVAATAGLPLISVMPDGGQGGWYTNWRNKGLKGQPSWETYHIDELIPWIDAHFRTVASRNGRAIFGLSMGGFGALSYAARHPDMFVAAGAFSGAVDTNTPPVLSPHFIDLISMLDGGLPGSLFGLREVDEVRWRGSNPWDLADNLRGMSLTIRCGDGNTGGQYGGGGPTDGASLLEYAVHPQNVSMEARLQALGIPHTVDLYKGGTHSWPYWNDDLRKTLPSIMATFASPPPAPVTFGYTSILPSFRVFDWSVAIARPAAEFATLHSDGAAGFELTGSGTATVTTAALYSPGAAYHAVIGDTIQVTRAGTDGRISLSVPLGPADALQEQFLLDGTPSPLTTHLHTTSVSITPA